MLSQKLIVAIHDMRPRAHFRNYTKNKKSSARRGAEAQESEKSSPRRAF
jgi:hypothetical protein